MEDTIIDENAKITCAICNGQDHAMVLHLKKHHADITIDMYKEQFPEAPLLSAFAQRKVDEARSKKIEEVKAAVGGQEQPPFEKKALHEIFNIGKRVKAAFNSRGEPIPITVLTTCEDPEMIPEVDQGHVYDLDILKNCLLALELRFNLYAYGHAGTGKTTTIEQVCAHTRRPMLRVQHSGNTEESHILGQWTAVNGQTKFELGPLPLAMQRGWVYLADEYDFAMPSVLAVYQPILEGKPLVIKEADAANRIIRPHPNFRFVATGNTNGSGDETGLYQGTSIQNAANYDRFQMVIKVDYMKPEMEQMILVNQAEISKEDAERIVQFATRVRESYDGAQISSTISPRTLIGIATLGRYRGSYRDGICLSFANKLTKVDREVVNGLAQRIFG